MGERAIFFEAVEKDDLAEQAALPGWRLLRSDPNLQRRIEARTSVAADGGRFYLDMPAASRTARGVGPGHAGGSPGFSGAGPCPRRSGPQPVVPLDCLAPSRRPDSLGRLGRSEVLEVIGQGGMGTV